MPLAEPPLPHELAVLPRTRVAGLGLHRVFRAGRVSPWWFASIPDGSLPAAHGRFDLPTPFGACYLALSAIGAVLEAFQHFTGQLPDIELRDRRRAEIIAPLHAPVAANLASARARGVGVTAAVWAGTDRALTQRWALALHRAGWRAIHHHVQHDPRGRERAVVLLDTAGEHPPYGAEEQWVPTVRTLHDDERLHRELARFGLTVTRSDVQLPVVSLHDSGLV
jgi:hypothetical protein